MFVLVNMLFLFVYSSSAQEFELRRTHAISKPIPKFEAAPAVGTLNIVAIMVEFQEDDNRLTSGTGIFGVNGMEGLPYLSRQEITYIDPLPHNQHYFEAHLEFAKNYFDKSSDGQLSIEYQVLPTVYQLEKRMEEYSPIGESFTTEKLALFLQDVWATVENSGGFDATGLDPDSTAFVVFHAGVGRDVELTGTSLDITPFDIPSIYMREADLEQWLGNDFDGFSINNGAFRIKNSMIIPRTESRRGEDISENEIVFPLSINGLLCASIGSHLGLPDLFNTETGEPAIGRFGLMDGAGFFGYNGLIPPEPSAWEKIFLGWETPFIISDTISTSIELPVGSGNDPNSIAKYELSSTEYFLIENRHRDINGTGVVITTRQPDGSEVQKTFTNEDEAFIFQELGFDSLLDVGTIIDVSNFDWSLPGGIDIGADEREGTDDDRLLNGGILIWHIDESVINQQLESGRVNIDPQRRGVDLEEGDGAQDIGLDVGLLDNSPVFGFAYDFWWSGNDYRVITQGGSIDLNPNNVFGPETYPNNNSNSGAKSFFEFYDFSENLPQASFKVRATDSQDFGFEEIISIQQPDEQFISSFLDYFPLGIAVYQAQSDTTLVITGANDVYLYDYSDPNPNAGVSFGQFLYQQPLVLDRIIIGTNPLSFNNSMIVRGIDLKTNSAWQSTTQPNTAFISSQDGSVIELDFTNTSIDTSDGSIIQNTYGYEFRSEIINSNFVGINGNTVSFVGENIPNYISNATERLFAGTISTNNGNLYYLFEDGTFTIVNPSMEEPFTQIFEEDKAEWPAIVDEGFIYRVNRSESSIEGYNLNGALLPNTPIIAPDGIQFIGTPLIADITGDNTQDILVVGQDEYSVNIFAYETTGEPISGFPLYVGGAVGKDIQPIHPVLYEDKLYAISHVGDLKAWRFENYTSSQWPSRYGSNPYNKVSAYINISEVNQNSFSILNTKETYNWPNPADEETNLRFEVESPGGTVEITVIDYSGRIVFERTVQATGGGPEEILISTADWGSGAYFAKVKATVGEKSESKLVKIGVAH